MKNDKKLVLYLVSVSVFLVFCTLILISYQPSRKPKFTEYGENISRFEAVESVEIVVLIDNHPNGSLKAPWGISLFIRTSQSTFLFDAGPDCESLIENAKILGVNLSKVDFIVISHEHGDHIGGLKCLSELCPNITVYVPLHMSSYAKSWIRNLGFRIEEIEKTKIVSKGIAIIGELYGPPYEQALAINVRNLGLVVLVGCSHPGVEKFVFKAMKELGVQPYCVIGGFHMIGASKRKINSTVLSLIGLGVRKIYPIHCSGDQIRTMLKQNYPNFYGDGCVGLKLKIRS